MHTSVDAHNFIKTLLIAIWSLLDLHDQLNSYIWPAAWCLNWLTKYCELYRFGSFEHWIVHWLNSDWVSVLDSIVVSIPACHAGDRGSIPRRGDCFQAVSMYLCIKRSIQSERKLVRIVLLTQRSFINLYKQLIYMDIEKRYSISRGGFEPPT